MEWAHAYQTSFIITSTHLAAALFPVSSSLGSDCMCFVHISPSWFMQIRCVFGCVSDCQMLFGVFFFGDFLRRFFWRCVAQVRVGVGGWIRVDCSNSRDTEFHYNGCKLLNFIFVNSIAYQTISFFFLEKKMLIDDGFWWIDGSFLGWSCWMIPDRAW